MQGFIEIDAGQAVAIYGGKDSQTAKLVEFIAECVGTIAKMIYMANQFRKMFISPTAL